MKTQLFMILAAVLGITLSPSTGKAADLALKTATKTTIKTTAPIELKSVDPTELRAVSTIDLKAATATEPVWIYKTSNAKDCGKTGEGVDAQETDLQDGKKELEAASIRVLSSEQNVSDAGKAGGRKCGDTGAFISCYLVFPTAVKQAAGLGFSPGSRCGKPFKTRVH